MFILMYIFVKVQWELTISLLTFPKVRPPHKCEGHEEDHSCSIKIVILDRRRGIYFGAGGVGWCHLQSFRILSPLIWDVYHLFGPWVTCKEIYSTTLVHEFGIMCTYHIQSLSLSLSLSLFIYMYIYEAIFVFLYFFFVREYIYPHLQSPVAKPSMVNHACVNVPKRSGSISLKSCTPMVE